MRIAINCRSFLKHNYAGIGRYAYNLVQSLSEIDEKHEYWLYAQKKYFDFKRQVPRIAAKNFHVKVDWLGRGIAQTLQSVDVYHSPSPDFINIEHAKIVVTVHDLVYKMYPQGHTQQTCEITEKQLQEITKKAHKIICCSQNTMKDLRQYFTVENERLSMVYQGVDKNVFYPLEEDARQQAKEFLKKKGIGDPFILFVGTIEPRKNLQNLLLAFSELKRKNQFKGKLVIVGMKGWMLEGFNQAIETLKLKDEIVFPGYVSDELLRYLYNLTEAFVFPSFYEGFGFPIIEAFSCGAPVVTSNVSSCPEIAADAASIVNPYDPEAMRNAMAQILDDQNFRLKLKARGLKRAQDFSFRKTAEQTLKVYQEAFFC
ncbi:MAG: glycosyltransferase family 4 protein [Candidatus Omnitrophica bacterium]|nr:glycosyltransferase family 4 protein [Candidatus Omnitrophota bacterium]